MFAETFDKARRKLPESQYTSDLQTDDECSKRKRTFPDNFIYYDDGIKKAKKKQRINHFDESDTSLHSDLSCALPAVPQFPHTKNLSNSCKPMTAKSLLFSSTQDSFDVAYSYQSKPLNSTRGADSVTPALVSMGCSKRSFSTCSSRPKSSGLSSPVKLVSATFSTASSTVTSNCEFSSTLHQRDNVSLSDRYQLEAIRETLRQHGNLLQQILSNQVNSTHGDSEDSFLSSLPVRTSEELDLLVAHVRLETNKQKLVSLISFCTIKWFTVTVT